MTFSGICASLNFLREDATCLYEKGAYKEAKKKFEELISAREKYFGKVHLGEKESILIKKIKEALKKNPEICGETPHRYSNCETENFSIKAILRYYTHPFITEDIGYSYAYSLHQNKSDADRYSPPGRSYIPIEAPKKVYIKPSTLDEIARCLEKAIFIERFEKLIYSLGRLENMKDS